MIPKIIHFFWENKDFSNVIPEHIKNNIESWKKLLPEYEFMFWNKTNLPIQNTNWLLQSYTNKDFGYSVDFVKPYVLYKYGGIYLDTDIELIKPFDEELLSKSCFFGWEHENYNPKFLGTAIIGAEKENKLIKNILAYYTQANYMVNNKVVALPSNYILMDIINGLQENNVISNNDYEILSQDYFYPEKITDNSYTKHTCHASWINDVSIVLPTENNIYSIVDILKSLFNQETNRHYEIIAVDNHSTDGTLELLRYYYEHSIIKLIELSDKECTYADCVEIGLRRATGRATIICNPEYQVADNVCEQAFKYCSNTITILGNYNDICSLSFIKKENIDFGNVVFGEDFRKTYLDKKQWFNSYFEKQDLMRAMILKAYIDDIKINIVKDNAFGMIEYSNNLNYLFESSNPNSELTACICFRNEGEEVENTIRSIKYVSDVQILLVDDCSNDGYNYKHLARIYGCLYHRMEKQVGSVGTKDWAGRNCPTKYFVLLDGHMRFFNYDIFEELENRIKENPKQIISPRTYYMGRKNGRLTNEDLLYKQKEPASYNCYITFDDDYAFDPKWTNKRMENDDCSCVLGACYCTSKLWWNYIDGFNGLQGYGLEEPFISLKTWLFGGQCKTLAEYGTGHLYRDVNINHSNPNIIDANRFTIGYLFTDDISNIQTAVAKRIGTDNYNEANTAFIKNIENLNKIKQDIKKKSVYNLDWFKENINNKVN